MPNPTAVEEKSDGAASMRRIVYWLGFSVGESKVGLYYFKVAHRPQLNSWHWKLLPFLDLSLIHI